MSVIRVNKNENYTVMSNHHLKDGRLSLKAKGLLSIMLSLSDGWHYSVAGLVAICKENETAIKSTLNELKTYGYLVVTKKLPNETESGRFEYVYDVYEQPQENQPSEKQGVENLPVEFQGVEYQGQLNTNKSSTNRLNTKILNTDREIKASPPTPLTIVDLYHETCPSLPEVQMITESRKEAIAELASKVPIAQIYRCFQIAESSNFLKGNNERAWKATFDWLIDVDNVAKVLEGNYANNESSAMSGGGSFDTDEFFRAAIERSTPGFSENQ